MTTCRLGVLVLLLSCCAVLLGQVPLAMPDLEARRGLVYRTIAGTSLVLDLYRPLAAEGVLPTVLLLHGGSWSGGGRDAQRGLARSLAAQGFAVAVADYRLAPSVRFPAPLEDARAAAAWLRAHAADYRLDAGHLSVLGVSAGGELAGLLATQPETAGWFTAAVTLAAPSDLTVPANSLKVRAVLRMYLGAEREERPDLYAAASPVSYLTADDPPFLLLHGQDDPLVPPAQSRVLAEQLRALGVPVALRLLPDTGHDMPAPETVRGAALLRIIVDFLHDPGPYARDNP